MVDEKRLIACRGRGDGWQVLVRIGLVVVGMMPTRAMVKNEINRFIAFRLYRLMLQIYAINVNDGQFTPILL